MLNCTPNVYLHANTELGECPIWDDANDSLAWIDLHKGKLFRFDTNSSQTETFQLPERVGAFGLRANLGEVIGLESGFYLRSDGSTEVEHLATIEADYRTTRLNDGRVAPDGAFICGGMDEADPQMPISGVYRLDGEGLVTKVISDVYCTNALCFSPDGRTMYFTNMATRTLVAYAYESDVGPVGEPWLISQLGDHNGLYDGAAVDETGAIWVAVWGGGCLQRYTPDGRLDQTIPMPVTNPTCCVFGGANYKTLFVTTAQWDLSDKQLAAEPLAGAIFALDLPVGGMPEHRFKG